jgi:hypothetical protein
MRRLWLNSNELYVPEVHWPLSSEGVLTMERVSGIHSDDIAALDAAGVDVQQLVLRGASSGDERVVRSMESTVRRHQVVDACARRWLDLAKCVLAQQRGEPVDPQANWDRAWRARDEWTRMVQQRG